MWWRLGSNAGRHRNVYDYDGEYVLEAELKAYASFVRDRGVGKMQPKPGKKAYWART